MNLGLGLNLGSRAGGVPAPSDIALSAATIAENAELGAVVGELSATDPVGGVTFSLTDDANGYFGIDGTDLILTGVLDFETANSHNVTVRATNSLGGTRDEVFEITVTDVSESFASEDDELPDDGEVEDDGTFTNPPTVTVVDGAIKLHGKKAAGSTGKFIYDIGPFEAGRKYTMLYDPDFSLMTLQGKKAFVGFGMKQGLDFRMTGLKGDGTTGLKAYEISGDGLWNATAGFTENDGGAAQNGTQAGPNWLQFEVAEDGSTYTARTSADGESWDDEFTDVMPSPFAEVTDATQGGIAVFFDGTDTGSFSVAITLWISADAGVPLPDLDPFSFIGAAARLSADLSSSPTASTDTAVSFNTQVEDTTAIFAPTSTKMIIPAGLDGRLCVVYGVSWISYGSNPGGDLSLSIRKNGSATFDGAAQNSGTTIYATQVVGSVQTQPHFVATGDEYEFYHITDQSGNTEADWTYFGIWVLS